MPYHPNPDISNNQAPIYDVSLSYEAHGKCHNTTVLSSHTGITTFVAGQDNFGEGNGWKVVFLENTTCSSFVTTNIPLTQSAAFTHESFMFVKGLEVMADITNMRIIEGTCIIYKNCNQS